MKGDGGKSQLQKISEVLLKPPDISTWTNNHQHLNDRSNFTGKLSSSFEKSIESFLFRSNFPVCCAKKFKKKFSFRFQI